MFEKRPKYRFYGARSYKFLLFLISLLKSIEYKINLGYNDHGYKLNKI
jgi:hypothetical protein